MIKMTHKTNINVDVKVVDLDINSFYSHNHMVRMDKISFSENFEVFFWRMSLMLGEEANTPLMLVKEVLTIGFQFVS